MSRDYAVENSGAELPQAPIEGGEQESTLGGLPLDHIWGQPYSPQAKESRMAKKDKKIPVLDTLLPKKQKSHKKRNALIGLAGATVAVVVAGAATKKSDSQ